MIRTLKRLARFKNSPLLFVAEIHRAVDFYYKNEVEKMAVCKKGCSHCCKISVDVPMIEAYYIHKKTGIKINEIKTSRGPQIDNSDCPFLKNNECSIYEYRPMNCRIFATLDSAEFCKDPKSKHLIYTTDSNAGLQLFREYLLNASGHGYAKTGDIREWFFNGKNHYLDTRKK